MVELAGAWLSLVHGPTIGREYQQSVKDSVPNITISLQSVSVVSMLMRVCALSDLYDKVYRPLIIC